MKEGKTNVLIADEKACVREELERMVCREESDFVLCGMAESGEEAVDKIIRYQPDLVLLNRNISGEQGMEVIREVRRKGFGGEIIILSDRPEFQDARAVIQYGVSDYITMPAGEEELTEAVRAVKEKTDRRRERERTLRGYIKKARAVVLYDLLRGGEADPSVNYIELGLGAGIYQVMIWESRKPEFRQSDLADQLMADGGRDGSFECVPIDLREAVLLKGQSALERFGRWRDSAGESAFLVYGEAVSDIREIRRSYSQCRTLMERRFFEKEDLNILSFEDLPAVGGEIKIDPAAGRIYSRRLFEDIESESRTGLLRTLEELREYLRQNNFEVLSVRYFLMDVFLQVKQLVTDTYGSSVEFPFEGNTALIKRIESEPFLRGICDYLAEQFEKVMNHIQKKRRADEKEGTEKVLERQ